MYKVIKTNDNKYSVKKDGAQRASKVFDKKSDADAYCQKMNSSSSSSSTGQSKSKKVDNNDKVKTTSSNKSKSKTKSKLKKAWLWVLGILGVGAATAGGVAVVTNVKSQSNTVEGVVYDEFKVNYLELGNEYAGDCTYIKAGDIDIVIDAGSRKDSAKTIKKYIDQYCTDGKIEYVIATHAHQDHIAGFVGSSEKGTRTGLLYQYKIGTIIDFALSNSASTLYSDYLDAIDYAVDNGAKHYTAAECWNQENGAKQSYQITDKVTMNILYNYYYFNDASKTDGKENNYSVCTLFTYNGEGVDSETSSNSKITRNFLFTGDLEKEGEEKLAEYYSLDGHPTLPHCDLFKGGHHGSKTSSNECLLSLITPDICCVCCCAGTTEYTTNRFNTFPTQDFINRIAKYTDKVYITSMYNEETGKFESMNGNIIVSCQGLNLGLASTNNLTKLKDSDWFSHTVYVDDKDKIVDKNTSGAKGVPCRTMPDEWKTS